ncbi:MAG: hypothetical protein RR551_07890 [Mucinivorans sp.]
MQQDNKKIRDLIFSRQYSAVGIAPYAVLEADEGRLSRWLSGGNSATLEYLARNARHDPRTVLADCKSVVVILFAPANERYHSPIRRELKRLLRAIQELEPSVVGRGVVDTAPIFEKSWAVRAGLGSIGLNTLLVNPTLGTDFNIGILLLDVVLPYDSPFVSSLCAVDCRACIEACPTGALLGDHTLDCRQCLSYLSQQTPGAAYGCLVCQQACPWNGIP